MQPTIPQLDLDLFQNEKTRHLFIDQIGNAFKEIGFVAIKNKYINQEDIEAYYEEVKTFFHLPVAQKEQYEIEGLAGQRGYTSFGKEHAKGSIYSDLKEFWQMGQIEKSPNPELEIYPENVTVNELPEFNRLGNVLYKGFEKTGSEILKAIALYLNLDENYFEPHIKKGNSILRAIHYPPITSEPENSIRAEAHEDINLITLLVGASADGLQLLSKNNEWLSINAPANYFVINVGDMLQRLTNNVLKSTTHRVVNPPREEWHKSRFSIPFFLHPVSQMDLTCLDQCVEIGRKPNYEPITAGKYLEERLVEIGLLKK
jgi:isopenicillin N synthase-like dioxygenase